MFCEKCGKELIQNQCSCGFIKFHNPVPVAVALIPIMQDGLFLGFLGVKRGIEPKIGEIAFPGGFQEIESIESALIREVKEECNLSVEIDTNYAPLVYSSEPIPNRLLVFFLTKSLDYKDINWNFQNEETLGLEIINENKLLAFPLHTKAKDVFFKKLKNLK